MHHLGIFEGERFARSRGYHDDTVDSARQLAGLGVLIATLIALSIGVGAL